MGETGDNAGCGHGRGGAGAGDVAWSSDRTLRVVAPGRVAALARALRERAEGGRLAAVRDVVPGAASVVVVFDAAAGVFDAAVAEGEARAALAGCVGDGVAAGALVTIPVCYARELGPDLDAVAAHTGMSVEEVVRRHTGGEYDVEFIGFSPGFAYLRGLDPALATPRLAQPRARVPAGSVAIGADRTAVYPLATPGGWRLIGRTPVRLFDASRERPAMLNAGDRVRFRAISLGEFEEQAKGAGR